jgi:hypothetical protein
MNASILCDTLGEWSVFDTSNDFSDSVSNTLFANSAVGLSSINACASSVMLSGGWSCVDQPLLTTYARAWAYLECVVGPELGIVRSGLSTTALPIIGLLVNTFGDNKVLGDCCMSPTRCPTLGSGMGSWKVTVYFFLFFSIGSAVALLRMLFIFCNTAILFFSPKVALMPQSRSKITNGLDYLIFSGNH